MAREKQTRRMIAMALAAAVTMSSVPVVAFAEGEVGEGQTQGKNNNIPDAPAEGETPVVKKDDIDITVKIPSTSVDDPETEDEENKNTAKGPEVGTPSGDLPDKPDDDEYDYVVTTQQGSVTVTTNSITETTVYENSEDLEFVYSETVPDGTNDLFTWGFVEEQASDDAVEPSDDTTEEPTDNPNHQFILVDGGNSSKFYVGIVFDNEATAEEKAKLDSFKKDPNNADRFITGPDGKTYWLHRKDGLASEHYVEGWYVGPSEEHPDGWLKPLNEGSYGASYSEVGQFVLQDAVTGEKVTVYCADQFTSTQGEAPYVMENLEDASYYTPEQAAMIRSIAENGYWGTLGTEEVQATDENGDPVYVKVVNEETGEEVLKLDENNQPIPVMVNKPAKGSLEAMKQMLAASGQFTDAELESLTDGVALTATQMAIWSFSNYMSGVNFVNAHYVGDVGESEVVYTGGYLYSYFNNIPKDDPTTPDVDEGKEDEVKLMFKVYEYLKKLKSTPITEENKTTENTIINADNFLKGEMEITVLEKAESYEVEQEDGTVVDVNKDDRDDNDAYVTNLSFALVVQPSTENGDDLVVSVVDGQGRVVAKGRVAGDSSKDKDDPSFTGIKDNGGGNYTFENIVMTEGDQTFNITMEGIQNLKEGVYLYTSRIETEDGTFEEATSQTAVGMAGGKQRVNTTKSLNFNFQVEDEKVVVRERHSSGGGSGSSNDPGEDTFTEIEDEPTPQGEAPGEVEIDDEEVPLVAGAEDVEEPMVLGAEEEVPLVAATGDSNHMAAGFGGMVAALAGMLFCRKKKEN